MPSRVLSVLIYLIRHRERLVTNQEVYERCWNETWDAACQNTLDKAISDLRRALGDSAQSPFIIRRVRGQGLQFIAPIDEEVLNSGVNKDHFRILSVVSLLATFVAVFWVYVSVPREQSHRARIEYIRGVTSSNLPKRVPAVFYAAAGYFSQIAGGHHQIIRKDLMSGNERVFSTTIPEPYVTAISPDAKNLLIRQVVGEFDNENSPLWIQPIDGSKPTLLEGIQGFDATWLPGSNQLIVCRGPSVLLYDLARRVVSRKLAEVSGSAWWPRVSRSGKIVRFTVQRSNGTSELWEAALTGAHHRLFSSRGQPWDFGECGSWSSDGSIFLFDAPPAGDSTLRERVLWAWDENSTHDPYPVLASGGTVRGASPTPFSREFWVRLESSGMELVVFDSQGRSTTSPWVHLQSRYETAAFDHRGDRIAYTTEAPGDELWIEAPGRQAVRLTAAPIQAAFPEWSPDDRNIAVAVRELDKDWKLRIIKAATGEGTDFDVSKTTVYHPSWLSNDEIVFSPIPAQELSASSRHLFTFDVARHETEDLPNSTNLYRATSSPSGRLIACLQYPNDSLWLYDPRSRIAKMLFAGTTSAFTWRNESELLILHKDKQGSFEVSSLSLSTSDLRTVHTFGSEQRVADRWFGLAPDGNIISTLSLTHQQFDSIGLQF